MLKAGGIGAAAGFVIALILTLITPLCDPARPCLSGWAWGYWPPSGSAPSRGAMGR